MRHATLLFIVNVVADDLYRVPQGVIGVWLMVVNRRLSSVLPRGITWFGTVVGFGLLLVGTFPLAYAVANCFERGAFDFGHLRESTIGPAARYCLCRRTTASPTYRQRLEESHV